MKTIVDFLMQNKKYKLNDIEFEIKNIYDDKNFIALKHRIYDWTEWN